VSEYERFGGADFFDRLTTSFYSRVAADPILRPMYPETELAPARDRLRMFLEQYWGGPTTYGELRGHPRLRMRHAGFPIDAAARDRWLVLMHESLAEQGLPTEDEQLIWQYFVGAAFAMQNIPDPASAGGVIDLEETS
jgi:hemoglobin